MNTFNRKVKCKLRMSVSVFRQLKILQILVHFKVIIIYKKNSKLFSGEC